MGRGVSPKAPGSERASTADGRMGPDTSSGSDVCDIFVQPS